MRYFICTEHVHEQTIVLVNRWNVTVIFNMELKAVLAMINTTIKYNNNHEITLYYEYID